MQRALSARDLSAARRTPLIGAIPKIFVPFITVLPGLIALAVIRNLGQEGNDTLPTTPSSTTARSRCS